MAAIIYGLCALAAFLCTCVLFQAYWNSRYQLLLWGALCFAGLTLNNVLVMMDKFVVTVDLSTVRLVTALVATLILLYGLIFDAE